MSVPACDHDHAGSEAAFHAALRALAPRGRARVDVRADTGQWAHSYAATVRLGELPPPGPFAWYLTNAQGEFEFVVFDLDPAGGDVGWDVAELVDVLEEADVRHLVCVSGPGRGLHVWVPVVPTAAAVVRALARAAARRLPSLDVSPLMNPRTGCIRPPGAPHRAGGRSVPVHGWVPITPQATARILADRNDTDAIERLAELLDVDQLADAEQQPEPGRAVEYAPDGPRLAGRSRPCDVTALLAAEPRPGEGHAHLARILVRLALARWSASQAARLLEIHRHEPGLIHLRRHGGRRERLRSEAERAALLTRQWERAVTYAASLRRGEEPGQEPGRENRMATVVSLVSAARAAVEADPRRWSTQAGPADRRALEYVLLQALEAMSDEIEVDCRRLALATNMGRSTAARALARLCREAWLCLASPGEGRRAHRYRVLPPPVPSSQSVGGTQGNPPPVEDLRCPAAQRHHHAGQLRARLEITGHDLFTHPRTSHQTGLGPHVAVTTAVLSTGPYKVNELARVTGYTPRTVRGHLQRLRGYGLTRATTKVPSTPITWRRTRRSLSSVAERIGATGTRERRHRTYATERQLYAWWLDELTWMRARGKRRQPSAAGQRALLLVGISGYARRERYPRDHQGRGDHRAAQRRVSRPGAA